LISDEPDPGRVSNKPSTPPADLDVKPTGSSRGIPSHSSPHDDNPDEEGLDSEDGLSPTQLEDMDRKLKVLFSAAAVTAWPDDLARQGAQLLLPVPVSVLASVMVQIPAFLPSIVQTNSTFTLQTVSFLLSKARTEGPLLQNPANEIIYALGRLPADLKGLHLIKQLVSANTVPAPIPDKAHLVHAFLATALRALEDLNSQSESTPVPFSESSQSGFIMSSAGQELSNVLGGQTGREAQTRVLILLVVFIDSLIRDNIISVPEIWLECQEIGVRYIFVPQAREFWMRVKALYTGE
jgi:hypothetical protein